MGGVAALQCLAAVELAQETEHLQVEPHDGHDQAKGREPLHVCRGSICHASLNEVEVQQQVEGGNTDNHQADSDAERGGVIPEAEVGSEQGGNESNEVHRRNSESGSGDSFEHLGCYTQDPEAVHGQHHEEDRKGGNDRLQRDSVGLSVVHVGDDSQEYALGNGVGNC